MIIVSSVLNDCLFFSLFPSYMASLRKKRELAPIIKENHQELPGNNQAGNTISPRIHEDYIIQVSEQIEGRVIEKLSQELSEMGSRILGTLSRVDEILETSQARTHSGPVPETSLIFSIENQGTIEDSSQKSPYPEMRFFLSHSSQELGPGKTSYMVTGVPE